MNIILTYILLLFLYILENKGWDIVAKERARADDIVASMHDSIYFFEEKRPKQPEQEVKP